MSSDWDQGFEPPTASDHTQLPIFDASFSEQGSVDERHDTLRERYDQHLRGLWSRPRSVFDRAPGEEAQQARRDMCSDPRPIEALREALTENATRYHIQQKPVVPPIRNWARQEFQEFTTITEDTWLPEPPLQQPPPSNESPWAFLNIYPPGNATLTYNDENGNLLSIHNLNLSVIESNSPIIAAAFEPSDRDERLHLDVLTKRSALPLLRFLYTGSYNNGQNYDDVPTSLLLHSELHFIASIFDMPDLRSEAWLNAKRQCEFACASPDKPIDLVAALRYCYEHIESNRRVIDDTIDYCIERYYAHKLKADEAFSGLTKEKTFCSDLAKACRRRNFEDESALDIIRLQSNDETPSEYASLDDSTNRRCLDVAHHFKRGALDHAPLPESSITKTNATEHVRQPAVTSALSLAIRGRAVEQANEGEVSSSDDDEGYKIVHPVSDSGASTPTDSEFVLVMRSRELASASVAAANTADAHMTSDDDSDWTMA